MANILDLEELKETDQLYPESLFAVKRVFKTQDQKKKIRIKQILFLEGKETNTGLVVVATGHQLIAVTPLSSDSAGVIGVG